MRSYQVVPGQGGVAQQYVNLRHDAYGAAHLLAHQQLGAIALPTNPTNSQTLTLTINGNAVVITFVSAIGTTAGNVLIGASAAATAANLVALLRQPQTTTATGVALSTTNQQFVSYLSWPLSGTTVTPSSNNTLLYAPLSSFSASTTVTGASWTAQTMQLYVEPGVVYVNGTRVIFAGGSTATVTAPSSHPRIDVLTIDNTGTLAWTTGTEASSPTAPAYPANKVALCELYNVVSETALYDNENQQSGQGYISNDVRPFLGNGMNWTAFTSDLIPDADGTRNLGSGSFEWNNLYVKSGIFLNGTSISAQLNISGIAGESISAGAAVALGYYQSDGGVQYDNSAHGNFTGTGATISFTVGNNTNRLLIITLARGANSAFSASNVAVSGTNPTVVQSQATTNGTFGLLYLLAPTVASTNNIVFSGLTSGTWYYTIHSYYNVAQSSQPDASAISIDTASTTDTASISTVANGSLCFGAAWFEPNVTPSSSPGIANNIQKANTQNPGLWAGDNGNLEPAGTYTAGLTFGSSTTASSIAVSFAPATAPALAFINASSASNNLRLTSFVGFANSSVSASAALVVIVGGVFGGLSGLSYGAQYYLNNSNGSIGTSPGSNTRKVGIAISTTQMLVTNIW